MTIRILAVPSLLLAGGLAPFAFWGLETVAGRHAFDEMTGMIPFAAALMSGLLLLVALFALWRNA